MTAATSAMALGDYRLWRWVLPPGLLFETTPEQAVRMPRRISFEDRWNPQELREQLEAMGHATGTIETVGMAQIIHIDDDGTNDRNEALRRRRCSVTRRRKASR